MVLVFCLPFCLLLPDGDYPVKLAENDIVSFHLEKVIPKIFDERLPYRGFLDGELKNISKLWIKGKQIDKSDLSKTKEFGVVTKYIDYKGKEIVPQLVKNDVNFHETPLGYMGRQVVVNTEVTKDSYGRFRYTKVIYTSKNGQHLKKEYARALSALNQLLYIYRVETSDYWITNLAENDILVYKGVSTKSQAYSIKDDHDTKLVNEIKEALLNPKPEHPFMTLILDSKKSSYEQNFHLSIIYAITALESIVKLYVLFYAKKEKFGNKVERKLMSLNLHLLITTILKMTVKSDQFTDEFIDKIVNSIRLRNKIIHESQLSVKEQDAKTAIKNVTTIARILLDEMTEYCDTAQTTGTNTLKS